MGLFGYCVRRYSVDLGGGIGGGNSLAKLTALIYDSAPSGRDLFTVDWMGFNPDCMATLPRKAVL